MTLKSLYTHFARDKESSWIMRYYNVEALYKFIQEHPIKRVLELGTGIGLSAAVCALAFKDKGIEDWHVDTMEQYRKCIDIAMQMNPKELDPDGKIIIHKADPIAWKTELIPHQDFSIYSKLPEGDYDLIINDGPSPFMEGEHYVDLPNGTIIKFLLEKRLKAGTFIAYDGRIQSLSLIERYFGDNFFLSQPANQNDFNVLERRENEINFRDDKLENMKEANYFKDEKENLHSNNSNAPSSSPVTPN